MCTCICEQLHASVCVDGYLSTYMCMCVSVYTCVFYACVCARVGEYVYE